MPRGAYVPYSSYFTQNQAVQSLQRSHLYIRAIWTTCWLLGERLAHRTFYIHMLLSTSFPFFTATS